jgi:teichuronic acid biosynthesis glycosyltransferase TuaC
MRIWAFPSFYPADTPGQRWLGIFAHRQYKGLIENGATLHVIIPVPDKVRFPFSVLRKKTKKVAVTLPLHRKYDGVDVYHPRVDNTLPYALDKRTYEQKFFDCLQDFFKKENIVLDPHNDIFFSQWLPNSCLVQYAAHKFGLKSAILSIGDDVVVWPHNSQDNKQAMMKLMDEADIRFACADYLGKEINKILDKNYSYSVINWGVDYDSFKPATPEDKVALREKYGLPQDKLLILNVGSAIIRKGWLDLFDALQAVRSKVDNFAIVGVHAGQIKIDLDKEAAARGLGDIFTNMAEVPPSQVNELFKAVDLFCLPSHWEGLANANIEAMSSGLPVITTDVCGHPELINDGENGMLVPPKRSDILAEKLFTLLTNKELRQAISESGRNFIVNKWGNFADNAVPLYGEMQKAIQK